MPIYLYECPKCGEYETHQSIHDPAHTRCINSGCSKPVKRLLVPVSILAYTPVGEKAKRAEARTYRQNKAIAEGLANGTMLAPDEVPNSQRDTVVGDKQSRESVRQFNEFYQTAKENKRK